MLVTSRLEAVLPIVDVAVVVVALLWKYEVFVPIMCVSGECGVLVFVPKIGLTHILLAIDPMFVAGGVVG